ncbi:MAG: pyridoxine 5'-phosphate synthase [Bacteroidaceae bacterium]|nr:pyridoxine 5'-phosphate synthase [Bacteroidaceae bacterium]MBR4337893.1 pyridoxine 5'-phosphate synthase [Bacteroidaceae bacterium]
MTRLSVNINKVATLRNARGGNRPDVLKFAMDCESFGADGITVHPRPDERHIRRSDVLALRPQLHTELNIEGFPSEDFMELVLSVRPDQVTLVPDSPVQLTSNHGWDVKANLDFLSHIVDRLQIAGIRSSIFINADCEQVDAAAKTGTDRIELYTEPYATRYTLSRETAIAPFVKAALRARICGLGLNAGHDLSLQNLGYFHEQIPWVEEVSIGHQLICDALYLGIAETIKQYKQCLV